MPAETSGNSKRFAVPEPANVGRDACPAFLYNPLSMKIPKPTMLLIITALFAACSLAKTAEPPSPQKNESTSPTPPGEKFDPTRLRIATRYSIERDEFGTKLSGAGWSYIDGKGNVVTEPRDAPKVPPETEFHDGLARFNRNGKTGFVDKAGKIVLEPQWERAGDFSEGVAAVRQNGKEGYIDKTGTVVIEPRWELAGEFHEGFAGVKENGKWGYIDRTGKVVLPVEWNNSGIFFGGLAVVYRNGKGGLIDKTGKVVLPVEWEMVWPFSEGMAGICRQEKCGFVDNAGKVVIAPQWGEVRAFTDGVAVVKRNGKFGCIDKTGKVVLEPQFEDLGQFWQGLAPAKQNGKWGLIDRSGRFVVEPQWDIAESRWGDLEQTHEQEQDEPVYWLLAREMESKAALIQPTKRDVLVKWLDSTGKQIWASEPEKPAG